MPNGAIADKSRISMSAARILALLWAECTGNWVSFLFPLPFFLGLFILAGTRGVRSLPLGTTEIWLFCLASLLLAMVYGLQCFSREADRKTLDFTMSRPISPIVLILLKYLVSLAVLLGWSALFQARVAIDLTKLPLAKGMGWEWLLLALLAVHGMGFFAGIISHGLERFMLVALMSGAIGWLCYIFWQTSFRLLTANHYWYDIPPVLYNFVCRGIPCGLIGLSVVLPLAGVLWRLRGCPRPWRFRPLIGVVAAWAAAGLLLLVAYRVFAPPLWPDREAISGDWRGNKIILLTPVQSGADAGNAGAKAPGRDNDTCLRLATLWRGARTIYTGTGLAKPRLSPDGQWIAFAEDGRIKALKLRDGKVLEIGPGHLATWSLDGKQLVLARRIGERGLSRLYQADLDGGKPVPLTKTTYNLADLAWDSARERLFIVGFRKELSCLDLRTMRITQYEFAKSIEPSIYFGLIETSVALDPKNDLLYLGLINLYQLQVYTLDLRTGRIEAVEEKTDRRMQTGAPLMIEKDVKALIWPRIDGSFVYQSVFLPAVREGRAHEHHEGHEDHEEH